jgi:hypothetical protein
MDYGFMNYDLESAIYVNLDHHLKKVRDEVLDFINYCDF